MPRGSQSAVLCSKVRRALSSHCGASLRTLDVLFVGPGFSPGSRFPEAHRVRRCARQKIPVCRRNAKRFTECSAALESKTVVEQSWRCLPAHARCSVCGTWVLTRFTIPRGYTECGGALDRKSRSVGAMPRGSQRAVLRSKAKRSLSRRCLEVHGTC